MIRAVVIAFSFIAVIAFPWPYALFLGILASLYLPLLGIVLGVFSDALYYAHAGSGIPWATIVGAAVSVLAFFARKFLTSRVSDLSFAPF